MVVDPAARSGPRPRGGGLPGHRERGPPGARARAVDLVGAAVQPGREGVVEPGARFSRSPTIRWSATSSTPVTPTASTLVTTNVTCSGRDRVRRRRSRRRRSPSRSPFAPPPPNRPSRMPRAARRRTGGRRSGRGGRTEDPHAARATVLAVSRTPATAGGSEADMFSPGEGWWNGRFPVTSRWPRRGCRRRAGHGVRPYSADEVGGQPPAGSGGPMAGPVAGADGLGRTLGRPNLRRAVPDRPRRAGDLAGRRPGLASRRVG